MKVDAPSAKPGAEAQIFAQQNDLLPCKREQGDQTGISMPAPSKFNPRIAEDVKAWNWKLSVLAPALAQAKGSRARGTALNEIASRTHLDINGNPIELSARTLRRWLEKADADDLAALTRKRRSDREERRCLISRAWDSACPLDDGSKAQIAKELNSYIRSLWVSGAPSARRIQQFATTKLLELCQRAGWSEATLATCAVGRHTVEQHRSASLVAVKEQNAKRFFDEYIPRIQRHRQSLKPMDIVIGDVHPLDVIKAHDGREVHARLIAWLDLATYDIHVTPVILDKGKGIRQEHIARSFVDMVEAWGLPHKLYLDNGSEYSWREMMEGFQALHGLTQSFMAFIKSGDEIQDLASSTASGAPPVTSNAVIRARPYNAPAKPIEAVFGILERGFFSLMPGWVGGDRMNKRTHNVGSAPRAYQGSQEEFERDIATCLELYRKTPQKDGASPYEKRAKHYAEGWKPITARRDVFRFAFSEVRRVKVQTGGINVDGTWGYADVLIPFIGKHVEIRVVKWDRAHTFYIDNQERMHAIPMGKSFDYTDPEGAKEQARRAAVLGQHIREMKTGTTRLNMLKEAERHISALPGAPELPEGIEISTADSAAVSDALITTERAAVTSLRPGQVRHPSTGAVLEITPSKANGSNSAPALFDPLKALAAYPAKKEKTPNTVDPRLDLLKAMTARQDKPATSATTSTPPVLPNQRRKEWP